MATMEIAVQENKQVVLLNEYCLLKMNVNNVQFQHQTLKGNVQTEQEVLVCGDTSDMLSLYCISKVSLPEG
jgi:hypothetical protein